MTITIIVQGRHIPAETYLAGIRLAKANPERMFKTTLWSWVPGTGREIREQYQRDLDKRINQRCGIEPRKSRVSLTTWGLASTPRVILGRHDIRSLNRHQRQHLAHRQRDEN